MATTLRSVCFTVVALVALVFTPLAYAKPPADVLEAYKSYRTALTEGDGTAARKWAQTAYDRAVDQLADDDPLIGTLAHNLADTLDDVDEQIKLYRIALETSPSGTEDEISLTAQRWVLLGQTHALRDGMINQKEYRQARRDIRNGWDYVQSQGLKGETFGAEMMVLMGWIAALDNKTDTALDWYERAETVFESPSHTYFSLLAYTSRVLRGKTLIKANRDIEAALVLQDVMQNAEGALPADHPYVQSAFNNWMQARGKIEMAGQTAEADAAGVCKCWPYDEMSADAPLPLVRVPPEMPRHARRSGHVVVKFDVSGDGTPDNIEALGYTDNVFVRPSIRSVKKWQYEIGDDITPEDLKGITTIIRFVLVDGSGREIPEDELKMVAEAG